MHVENRHRHSAPPHNAMPRSFNFEVFGKVQGVFFRKYTQKQAVKLGCVGWCMNTSDGTVVGVAQGTSASCRSMVDWLTNTGSPKSEITGIEITEKRSVDSVEFDDFEIRR